MAKGEYSQFSQSHWGYFEYSFIDFYIFQLFLCVVILSQSYNATRYGPEFVQPVDVGQSVRCKIYCSTNHEKYFVLRE